MSGTLADVVAMWIADGLRCSDCGERIEDDESRSVTEDDRVFCADCYEEQDHRDPHLGPRPTVPRRKGATS